MALGARAIHLVRRFSVEGLLLSLPGGLGAVLLATVTLLGLRSLLPVWIPAADRLTIDLTTIAFGVIVMTTVGVAAGTVTAILFAKRSIGARLSGGIGITLGGLGSRVWSTLVVVQIGLACTLAVLSLQASQAYAQMRNIRIGYTPTDLHTFTVALGVRHGGIDAQVSLVESIRSAIASLPTVRGVAVADHAPLRSIGGLMLFELPRDRGRGEYSTAKRLVDERYFPLLRTSITAGRGFLPTDGPGAPWVAVVNTAFSRRYLRGHGLGESLVFGGREPATIVGIVEDVRDVSARSAAEPTVYFSLRQCLSEPSNERIRLPSSFHFLIAGRSAERELWRGVRQAVSTVDRGLPIQEPASLERDLQIATSDHRLGAGVLTFLAACAILLASTGVYGVCFYSISQRSRELAIRMSLGATSGMLYRMLLVETVKRAGTGLALFIPASAALGSAIRAQLFDAVAPTPMMMMMASLAVVFSTVVATFLASRIVVHLAPAVALHRE